MSLQGLYQMRWAGNLRRPAKVQALGDKSCQHLHKLLWVDLVEAAPVHGSAVGIPCLLGGEQSYRELRIVRQCLLQDAPRVEKKTDVVRRGLCLVPQTSTTGFTYSRGE